MAGRKRMKNEDPTHLTQWETNTCRQGLLLALTASEKMIEQEAQEIAKAIQEGDVPKLRDRYQRGKLLPEKTLTPTEALLLNYFLRFALAIVESEGWDSNLEELKELVASLGEPK
jgi:hypothetical protein